MLKTKGIALLAAGVLTGGLIISGISFNQTQSDKLKAKVESVVDEGSQLKENEKQLLTEINNLTEEAKTRLRAANSVILDRDATIEEKQKAIKDLTDTVNKLNTTINNYKKENEKLLAENKNLITENSGLKDQVTALTNEITGLKNKIEELNSQIGNKDLALEEAQTEITRLEGEVQKANDFINSMDKVITDEDVNNIVTDNNADTINELVNGKISELDELTPPVAENLVVSGWGTTHIQLDFNLKHTIDLSQNTKANVIIEYYVDDNTDAIYSKNKTWSGYLNNPNGVKFAGGFFNEGYENVLPIDTYGTAINSKPTLDVTSITKVIVTVIDNNGYKTILEANK